jgi:hypothetical protein
MSAEVKIVLNDITAKRIKLVAHKINMKPEDLCLFAIHEKVAEYHDLPARCMVCDLQALEKHFSDYQALQQRVKELEAGQCQCDKKTGGHSRYSGEGWRIQSIMWWHRSKTNT